MTAQDPGWYVDPEGSDRLRYWDGSHWTDAFAPASQAPVLPAAAPPPAPAPALAPADVPFGQHLSTVAAPAPQRPKGLVLAAVVLAVLALVVGALVLARVSNRPTPLRTAYDACRAVDTQQTVAISDRDQTLVIDTGSKYGSIAGADCVFTTLSTPQSVIAAVDSTSALMGVRNATEDGLEYSWTYHPDNGLNMVIKVEGS